MLRRIVSSILLFCLLAAPSVVYAQDQNADLEKNVCGGASLSLGSGGSDAAGYTRGCINPPGGVNSAKRLNDTIGTVINILTVVIGIVAVIMIIVGAFRFITSGGDAGKVSGAKNTVLFALIGLIIVALAQLIAGFVLKQSTGLGGE